MLGTLQTCAICNSTAAESEGHPLKEVQHACVLTHNQLKFRCHEVSIIIIIIAN